MLLAAAAASIVILSMLGLDLYLNGTFSLLNEIENIKTGWMIYSFSLTLIILAFWIIGIKVMSNFIYNYLLIILNFFFIYILISLLLYILGLYQFV